MIPSVTRDAAVLSSPSLVDRTAPYVHYTRPARIPPGFVVFVLLVPGVVHFLRILNCQGSLDTLEALVALGSLGPR